MRRPEIIEITQFDDNKIREEILQKQKELFNLKFKKATRQPFKSDQIKKTKRRIAQLRTILGDRIKTAYAVTMVNPGLDK